MKFAGNYGSWRWGYAKSIISARYHLLFVYCNKKISLNMSNWSLNHKNFWVMTLQPELSLVWSVPTGKDLISYVSNTSATYISKWSNHAELTKLLAYTFLQTLMKSQYLHVSHVFYVYKKFQEKKYFFCGKNAGTIVCSKKLRHKLFKMIFISIKEKSFFPAKFIKLNKIL